MNHFPVFLELRDRPVLVVGGTAMAARRCKAVVTAGARVRVVAPALSPAFDDCQD